MPACSFRCRHRPVARPLRCPDQSQGRVRDLSNRVQTVLAELEDQQKLDKAILAAGNPRFKEELWINHRMLQLFGLLSLYFCCDGYGEDGFKEECLAPIPSGYTPDGSIELHITPNADGSVKMAPYPFDVVPLRVSVRARRMQPGRYASEAACRAAYFAGRYPSRVQPDDCLLCRSREPRPRCGTPRPGQAPPPTPAALRACHCSGRKGASSRVPRTGDRRSPRNSPRTRRRR